MNGTIRAYIAAARALATNPGATLPQYVRRNSVTASILGKTCLEGLGYIQTAIEEGISDQQVRNILDGFAGELITHARTGAWSGKYVPFHVGGDVLDALRRIDADSCEGMSVAHMRSELGGCTAGCADVVMRAFGCNTYGPVDSVVSEAYAIPKGTGRALTPVLRSINSLLKDSVAPVRESGIRMHLRKEEVSVVDTALALMRHSSQYEHTEKDGISWYSLTWKELDGVQKRVERILWEHRGESMEKTAIVKEYLTRLRACGVGGAPKDVVFKESGNIGGANGLWRWKEEGSVVVKDCRPLIQDYVVRKDAPVTLDEIVAFVDGLGVKLSRSSVETYLTLCCRHRRKHGDYVLKEVDGVSGRGDVTIVLAKALRKSGGPLSVSEMATATGVNGARVYRTLTAHPDIFEKIAGASRRGGDRYRVSGSWDGSYTPADGGVRRTPAYYEVVRQATIQMLRGTDRKEMGMNVLRDRLTGLIPDIISSKASTVSKLMRRYDDFVVMGSGKGRKTVRLNPATHASDYTRPQFSLARDWAALKARIVALGVSSLGLGRREADACADAMLRIMGMDRPVRSGSYFHLMAEMLNGWFAGELKDRDLEYTRNLLALNYEKFLRNLHEMVNGCVLWTKPGLGNVVKDLQESGMLPPRRYGDWRSEAISHIITVRGAVAHPDMRDSQERIDANIREFIRLFLFTSSLLTKEEMKMSV